MNDSLMIAGVAIAVPAILLLFKCYILFRSARRKTIRRLFYFTQQEIIEAPSPQAAQLRKTQNVLSVAFFILLALSMLLLYLFHK